MTQEEKAKAYDEAIGKAQDILHSSEFVKITDIFPELKESEDERIKKEIVRFIRMEIEDEIVGNKWIAWLEKQGEQKLANSAKPCDDANDTDEEIVEAVEQKNAEWHGLKLKGRRKYLEGE